MNQEFDEQQQQFYHQNENIEYIDEYDEDNQNYNEYNHENCGDISNLEVPNTRLYTMMDQTYYSTTDNSAAYQNIQNQPQYTMQYEENPKDYHQNQNQYENNNYYTEEDFQNYAQTYQPLHQQYCTKSNNNNNNNNREDEELMEEQNYQLTRKSASKKRPISVKTVKYVTTKNAAPTNVNKKSSVLCLPVITQRDPGQIKRKSQVKKKSIQNKTSYYDSHPEMYHQHYTTSYSAHKMNSQGDVKNYLTPEELDTFLDNYEHNVIFNKNSKNFNMKNNTNAADQLNITEFAKFLKPRVPASILRKQQELSKMQEVNNNKQPKLKLSLDKLLDRLQKCETDKEMSAENSQKNDEAAPNNKSPKETVNKVNSFNYEELSQKCPTNTNKISRCCKESRGITKLHRNNNNNNKTVKVLKSMDDNFALDLHKSKSYIVNLIDRALSKELGTIPRDSSNQYNFTPSQAVATISSNQNKTHELTAVLTDSILSSVSAPPRENSHNLMKKSFSDEDNYLRQLKQLRWGHIRHIQHEVKKLADLEEFLEKCGEINY